MFGALEAGGTKMVCAIGDEFGKIQEQVSIKTTTPEETIPEILQWFKAHPVEALGIASFGPIDLNRNSKTYGYITTTPKLAWANFDLVGTVKRELHVPIGFDTDVNGSLLGEVTYGQAKGLKDAIYLTIGTGIGGGVMTNGKLLHGMLHPELGHMPMVVHPKDTYKGHCPFHGTCLEGMAAGPAIEERWGKKGSELADRQEVWELEAYYIGQALTTLILTLSPEMIILGGGVMHQQQLFPEIRAQVSSMLNGYLNTRQLNDMEHYIVPASLHDDQGIMGCLKLAVDSLHE
jgi:fructokinase